MEPPPFIYSISGTLPTGLYFNAISASIFGTSSVMPVSSIVYQIELFVTDSFNNTASQMYYLTASYCGAWEPWDEYFTGSDVIGLNGGYGFSSPWYVKPDVNFVQQVFSYEDFEEYNTGSDLNRLSGGLGFQGNWYVNVDTNIRPSISSYEDFEEYDTGSNLNGLNEGAGFSSSWFMAPSF